MATYVSPGIYVVENDNSDYVPSINPSVVGIVGFASKGPVDKATLITTEADLIDTFGDPLAESKAAGQGLEGAIEVLETTNSVYFVRCASGGVDASVSASYGVCPAVCLASSIGDTSAAWLEIQVENSQGVEQYNTALQVFVSGSGDTKTGISGYQLESSTQGTGSDVGFKILGSAEADGSFTSAGTTMDVYVLINEHFYKAAVAGI